LENAAPDYVSTMPAKKKQLRVSSKNAQHHDSPTKNTRGQRFQRQAEVQQQAVIVETQAEVHQQSEPPEESGAESDASSSTTTKKKPR